MLHYKMFNDIQGVMVFANAHSIIPIGFFSQPSDSNPVNNKVCLVYEAVEVPEPNNHHIDLLAKTKSLLGQIVEDGWLVTKDYENDLINLNRDISKCLNLR